MFHKLLNPCPNIVYHPTCFPPQWHNEWMLPQAKPGVIMTTRLYHMYVEELHDQGSWACPHITTHRNQYKEATIWFKGCIERIVFFKVWFSPKIDFFLICSGKSCFMFFPLTHTEKIVFQAKIIKKRLFPGGNLPAWCRLHFLFAYIRNIEIIDSSIQITAQLFPIKVCLTICITIQERLMILPVCL